MGSKIKAQLLEARETKNGFVVKVIVPLGSFKMKDLAFGGKSLSLCIEDKPTITEWLKANQQQQIE